MIEYNLKMELLYLDINCYQRSFDNQDQLKIYLETQACQEIFFRVETNKIKLAWSFMHDNEIRVCKYVDRREEAFRLAKMSKLFVDPSKKIINLAKQLEIDGISSKDAVHLACAISCKASRFISCDRRLVDRAKKFDYGIEIQNPLEYIGQGD